MAVLSMQYTILVEILHNGDSEPLWMHPEARYNFIGQLRRWTKGHCPGVSGTIVSTDNGTRQTSTVVPTVVEAMLYFASPVSWMGLCTLSRLKPEAIMYWYTVREWEHADQVL